MNDSAATYNLCLAKVTRHPDCGSAIVFIVNLEDVVREKGRDGNFLVPYKGVTFGSRKVNLPPDYHTLELGVPVLNMCVSRSQFRVHRYHTNRDLHISNTSFTNPTHVNAKLLMEPHKLSMGDVITIGRPRTFATGITGKAIFDNCTTVLTVMSRDSVTGLFVGNPAIQFLPAPPQNVKPAPRNPSGSGDSYVSFPQLSDEDNDSPQSPFRALFANSADSPAYSPTSPRYDPASPAYSPTSPAYSPTSPRYDPASPPRLTHVADSPEPHRPDHPLTPERSPAPPASPPASPNRSPPEANNRPADEERPVADEQEAAGDQPELPLLVPATELQIRTMRLEQYINFVPCGLCESDGMYHPTVKVNRSISGYLVVVDDKYYVNTKFSSVKYPWLFKCKKGHFLCRVCADSYIMTWAEHQISSTNLDQTVKCPLCTGPEVDRARISREEYETFAIKRCQEQLNRIAGNDQQVDEAIFDQQANTILSRDDSCSIACPWCGLKAIEVTGCMSICCTSSDRMEGRAGCGRYFCAWCFRKEPRGSQANHQHLRQCEKNPHRQEMGLDAYFVPEDVHHAHWRSIVAGQVLERINQEQEGPLKRAMMRYFERHHRGDMRED